MTNLGVGSVLGAGGRKNSIDIEMKDDFQRRVSGVGAD
jgi:hypothetical protein